jgi:VPDSG-CTERM motif
VKKLKYVAPILIAVACLGLQQAKADTSTFFLASSNVGGFNNINMVQVSITTSGTNQATVSFTSQTANVGGTNYIFMIGSTSAFDLNTSASATTGNYVFTQPAGGGFSPPSVTGPNGSGQVGQWGAFNNTNTMFNGFMTAVSGVTFTLTRSSGLWGSAASVLSANANDQFAAAHIFITLAPGNRSNGAIYTGFASVPDGGATVMLLGVALGGLGLVRRYLMS